MQKPERSVAILDTNILHYGCDPNTAESISVLLKELSLKYDLAITDYNFFELFRGLRRNRVDTASLFIESFTRLPVDRQVYKIAAVLSTCYGNDEATRAFFNRYGDGDILIASTAFKYNAFMVTANLNDFPKPYFHEGGEVQYIISRDNKHIAVQPFCPDIRYFNEKIAQYYPNKINEKKLKEAELLMR